MKANILEEHGPLCTLYQAYKGGDDNEGWGAGSPKQKGSFRSEGDSPAFIHTINTGLRNIESPDYGGWGGRYIKVRENTWLDPVPNEEYIYPEGRWYTKSAWGRVYMRDTYPKNQDQMAEYFKPLVRWTEALQNDFAARADWCIKPYDEANHPPIVKINQDLNLIAKPGSKVLLSADETYDPDGNELYFRWWNYVEVSNYKGDVKIENSNSKTITIQIPNEISQERTIHIICEVKDNGTPQLTRYRRIIIKVKP